MKGKNKSCRGCKALSLNNKTKRHACYYGHLIENDSFSGDCLRPKTWRAFRQGVVEVYGNTAIAKVKGEG